MYKVVICDNNVDFCNLVEVLVKKYEKKYEVEIVKFYDGRQLLDYCRENKFDILILDIELGEENGLDIAKILKGINPKSLMIYISAYDDYYRDMVNAEPFRFIKKDATDIPKLEKELVTTLADAINRLNSKDEYTFIFKKISYTIELHKVKYFCSIGRTIHICGDIGSVPPNFYYKMDQLAEELQEIDENFVRISKSYIVNINYVKVNSKKQIVVDNKILSITSKYRADFFKSYYSKIGE